MLSRRLFDPESDAAFERLARLAMALTGAAVGIVWLVDDDRVVRRSVQGSEGLSGVSGLSPEDRQQGTPVRRSWCAEVLLGDAPIWVDDLAENPVASRSAEAASSGAQAWAGCPVRAPSGTAVGVLGVMDVRGRAWSAQERDVLVALAQAATGEIARRAATPDVDAQEAREAGEQAKEAGAAARYYEEQARSATVRASTSDQVAVEAQRLSRLAERHVAEVEEFAATLRESLLPARLPAFPGVEVAARYRPGTGASVLGDFYDLFPTPGGWGAVVGDVCGKGPQAARTTALARSTVRAVGHTDDDPAAVLAALHDVLHVWFDQRPSFVTAVYVGMSPRTDGEGLDLRVASAGHPPGVIQRRDGSLEALEAGGLALGIRPRSRITVEHVTLDVGDRLLLFTDGVTEARPVGGREFELEGLLALLAELDPADDVHATADAVLAAVHAHAAGAALDDTALLVVRAARRDL